MLSRFPILEATRLDLTVARCEPRGALDVVIDAPVRPLRCLATHLGLAARRARLQVKQLLRVLEHETVHPTVLTGDVNEWYLWGRPLRWLHAHFGVTPRPADVPGPAPRCSRSTGSGPSRPACSRISPSTARPSRATPAITCRCSPGSTGPP